MQKTKIVILGLGGVGGYYGGRLAAKYENNSQIAICFIARNAHLEAIKEKGLHVITDDENFYGKPAIATDKPEEIGICDYVIIATKSYDLKSSINQIRACIDKNTVILPLLNGGNISEQISEILPENKVWSGLSYIVSRKTAPGEITTKGDFSTMVFGCDCNDEKRLKEFETIALNAGIDARLSKNIRFDVWRKFFFISVSASLTSYFNITFNELVNTEEKKQFTLNFAKEFLSVAKSEGIDLGKTAQESIVDRMTTIPAGTTSSMHSDFLAGSTTEVENLTGLIVRLAQKNHISVPLYDKVYAELKSR